MKPFLINENEIALSYDEDGKIYGSWGFLMFYDLKNFKEIKTLKLGGCYTVDVCFLNENYLAAKILEHLL